jgi:hypothetical protein
MRPWILAALAVSLLAGAALAVDPGKAEGTVIVDGTRINVIYAYSVNHQKNEITNRKDDRRVILTNKALPDGFKLDDIDYSFPEDTLGMVVCLTHDDKVSHVLVQHQKGMYDAGYFDGDPSYTFKPLKNEHGSVAGNVSSRKVKTNTMSFSFDVDFNAAAK